MIPYEDYLPLLPHEYSYALYLSYEFDLYMYDPMILNMVSERYPRDEDYASNSDSDSTTEEEDCVPPWLFQDHEDDFDFGDSECVFPPWLFFEKEDEDASLLLHDNNHIEIVFGNFDQVSDLNTISNAPLVPIEAEFDGYTIKIGEISCYLTSAKQSYEDGGSLEKVVATKSLDLESNTTDLQSNTTEEFEQKNPSITIADFIVAATEESTDPEVKDEQKLEKIATHESNFLNLRSEIVNLFNSVQSDLRQRFLIDSKKILRYGVDPFQSSFFLNQSSTMMLSAVGDFVSTEPDLFYHVLHLFGLATTVLPQEQMVERCCTMKETLVANDFVTSSPSFFNQSSIAVLAAADAFVCTKSLLNLVILNLATADDFDYAKSFPNISVPEEKVKEMEEVTAPPWKKREEDKLSADLWNLASSPEPPWEILRRGFQPRDPGVQCRDFVSFGSRTFSLLHHTRCLSSFVLGLAHFLSHLNILWFHLGSAWLCLVHGLLGSILVQTYFLAHCYLDRTAAANNHPLYFFFF